MRAITIALVALALLACGSESGDVAGTPDVDAAGETAYDGARDAAGSASKGMGAAAGSAAAGTAAGETGRSCLGLVDEARFAEAVPVCTKALGMDPKNQEIRDALATAKAEAADLEAAAQEAAGSAIGEAQKEAQKGLGERLPGAR